MEYVRMSYVAISRHGPLPLPGNCFLIDLENQRGGREGEKGEDAECDQTVYYYVAGRQGGGGGRSYDIYCIM